MSLLQRSNDALNVNPANGVDSVLSLKGSNWLWAVTAIYGASFLALTALSFTPPPSKRVFHYLFTCLLLTGLITSFASASDLGWTAIPQADHTANSLTRQVFYTKYIHWAVTFPSLALALGLACNVSWTTILCNVFIAVFWVVAYLAAALTSTEYKWGFFTMGTFAYVILAMSTLNESYEAAAPLGIGRDYMFLAGWVNVLWALYPVAFGLGDGGNIIGVAGSFVFTGVLDVLVVSVLTFVWLGLAHRWDWERLSLDFSESRVKGAGSDAVTGKQNENDGTTAVPTEV